MCINVSLIIIQVDKCQYHKNSLVCDNFSFFKKTAEVSLSVCKLVMHVNSELLLPFLKKNDSAIKFYSLQQKCMS